MTPPATNFQTERMNTPTTHERIARALQENLPSLSDADPRLRAALVQSTGNPGKLVRARLAYVAARSHGLEDEPAAALAAAVEYFHVASLLFDDLPCMDDAWTRRGQPCAHRLHGEAAAVLAALAFINRAYVLIGFVLADRPLSVRLQATACLDSALGLAGLVGGQARDLNFAATDRSARSISRIAAAKTGALFWLAVYLPALLGQPDEHERRSLKALCVHWGLAFQVADDLQDVLLSSLESGKTSGRDERLDRPNLALALGVPAASTRLSRLMRLSERALGRLVARGGARWVYLVAFHTEFADPLNELGAATKAA